MIDCLPDARGKSCLNCGWVKPEKIEGWPRRNCAKSPNLLPAAERLGLTLDECQPFIQQLAAWMAAGYPERTEAEQSACKEVCDGCPDHAAVEDRCQCNSCSSRGQQLTIPRRLATWKCPVAKWRVNGPLTNLPAPVH